jgi:hypothetical protein
MAMAGHLPLGGCVLASEAPHTLHSPDREKLCDVVGGWWVLTGK